eukprot:6996786-Pyramimonas_sp.AAC.1
MKYSLCRWTEAGGNVCIPWCKMGKQLGWLDDGSVSALIWAYSSKFYAPDTILQECVTGFDFSAFEEIMGKQDPLSPTSVFAIPSLKRFIYRGGLGTGKDTSISTFSTLPLTYFKT